MAVMGGAFKWFNKGVDMMNDSNSTDSAKQGPNEVALLTKVYSEKPSPDEVAQDFEGLLALLCVALKEHRATFKRDPQKGYQLISVGELVNTPDQVFAVRDAINDPKNAAYCRAVRDVGWGLFRAGGTSLMLDVLYRVSEKHNWLHFEVVADNWWDGIGHDNDQWRS